MYLVCISFGELPRELSEFPAFSAENKTFNKINLLCQRSGSVERRKCIRKVVLHSLYK